ncbi:predicted protein, partial [Haematococcus lacustris]
AGNGVNALPPASPATRELDVYNTDVTVFLIGAYAKYNWPYVWLRSLTHNHVEDEIDSPLDLPSTKNWKARTMCYGMRPATRGMGAAAVNALTA